MPSNKAMSGNITLRDGVQLLRDRLPPGWSVSATPAGRGRAGADARIRLVASDRTSVQLPVSVKANFFPRVAVAYLAARSKTNARAEVLLAPHLSSSVRELLRSAGVSYIDLTGNIRLVVARPGLFVESTGADINPVRSERPGRTLRGAMAGRIVRALVDKREPPGVRELAQRTGANAGYVSRLLAWMDREALVERRGRGQLVSVDWQLLLRRWTDEAPLSSRGAQSMCLAARGLTDLKTRLRQFTGRYALTGSLAVTGFAPVAPAKLAVLYLDQQDEALDILDLRPVEAGANVLCIAPIDEGVFVGVRSVDGVRCVAPSQAAADLLSSPGRGPTEGEALIEWMAAHEDVWRG